jgi:hypothetical protein
MAVRDQDLEKLPFTTSTSSCGSLASDMNAGPVYQHTLSPSRLQHLSSGVELNFLCKVHTLIVKESSGVFGTLTQV